LGDSKKTRLEGGGTRMTTTKSGGGSRDIDYLPNGDKIITDHSSTGKSTSGIGITGITGNSIRINSDPSLKPPKSK